MNSAINVAHIVKIQLAVFISNKRGLAALWALKASWDH